MQRHPGFSRRWYEADPKRAREVSREASRRAYWADPERAREAGRRKDRAWREANPERSRALSAEATRRTRQRARDAFLALYGKECVCCRGTEKLTIDHVFGDGKEHRARYGNDGYNYLTYRDAVAEYPSSRYQTLCLRCNVSKSDGDRCRLDHGQA